MTTDTIYAKLQTLFRELFEDDSIVLTPETTARDVERWDSLSHVDMMVMAEELFGIRFSTREVTGLPNVGALVQVIERKVGAA